MKETMYKGIIGVEMNILIKIIQEMKRLQLKYIILLEEGLTLL